MTENEIPPALPEQKPTMRINVVLMNGLALPLTLEGVHDFASFIVTVKAMGHVMVGQMFIPYQHIAFITAGDKFDVMMPPKAPTVFDHGGPLPGEFKQ